MSADLFEEGQDVAADAKAPILQAVDSTGEAVRLTATNGKLDITLAGIEGLANLATEETAGDILALTQTMDADTSLLAENFPAVSGQTAYRNIDLDETGVVVKNSAARIVFIHAFNNHATDVRFLKLYNKATAATSSDTPVYTIPLSSKGGFTVTGPMLARFGTGLSLRATTDVADAGTGAPGANEVLVNITYL